ncbi:hypothetical protein BD830_102183 [Maritimibacter alkaliphilus HTCC2654]|uniref:hypothetical protein n=1 Tax=Maritimibacter alkaliphilus TaxID=404236 RepID=UPI0002F5191A|nr:hypothetical protein [Maritimibacter alkaliphilus]TYP84094.1 hypothetical protein BD830_102183 [Maritimibacter alkaliphilus HTCC2654]
MTSKDASTRSGEREGVRYARELNRHITWLDSFTGVALGVLAAASGIYTYLGVRSLLDDTGAWTTFAALSYSLAVSVGIFVFWSYMLRLLPAMRTAASRLGLMLSMALGSVAIVAMSSWLNAAALAGAAAVEQHLAHTVQDYQTALERAHSKTIAGQALQRDVARARETFQDLSAQEDSGNLSGLAGRGAVFRVLTQKSAELQGLEDQIAAQEQEVAEAFAQGNAVLSRMRALSVEPGAVEARSVRFAEEAVRLSGLIAELRQLNVAPLVARASADLRDSVVLPDLDAGSAEGRASQQSTIASVMTLLADRASTLETAAAEVQALPDAEEIEYTPLSAADAVIRYAGNFVPSWAGAIAIDLLPAVLVFVLMVTHAAIRQGNGVQTVEDTMTVAEMRAALDAARSLDMIPHEPDPTPPERDSDKRHVRAVD